MLINNKDRIVKAFAFRNLLVSLRHSATASSKSVIRAIYSVRTDVIIQMSDYLVAVDTFGNFHNLHGFSLHQFSFPERSSSS